MNFLKKYNFYKSMIVEGTVKTLYHPVQEYVLKHNLNKPIDFPYNDLSKEQQQKLNTLISIYTDQIKTDIRNLKNSTDIDSQFESWFYDMAAKWYQLAALEPKPPVFESLTLAPYNSNNYDMLQLYIRYKQLCRSPKIEKQYKNIQNFKTIGELDKFVSENKDLLIKNVRLNFNKVYTNNSYDIYQVKSDDQKQFQKIYGVNGYNCGWCVANSEKDMFKYYISEYGGDYYLWTYKGTNKPFALFHRGSQQFKDIHNTPIESEDNDVLDGLYFLYPSKESKIWFHSGDLVFYPLRIQKWARQNKSLGQYICDNFWNGLATYDPNTNTVDCHGNYVYFRDEDCFDENGSFDFKMINLNPSLARMFRDCEKLESLPDSFIIPDYVTNCNRMFHGCFNLSKIPEGFNIPNSVENCKHMFEYCENLHTVSNKFKINNTKMFQDPMGTLNDMFYDSGLTYEDVEFILKNSNCPDDLIQTIADLMI